MPWATSIGAATIAPLLRLERIADLEVQRCCLRCGEACSLKAAVRMGTKGRTARNVDRRSNAANDAVSRVSRRFDSQRFHATCAARSQLRWPRYGKPMGISIIAR